MRRTIWKPHGKSPGKVALERTLGFKFRGNREVRIRNEGRVKARNEIIQEIAKIRHHKQVSVFLSCRDNLADQYKSV